MAFIYIYIFFLKKFEKVEKTGIISTKYSLQTTSLHHLLIIQHSKFCKGRIKSGFQSSWLYCNVHFGLSADDYDSVRYLLRPLGLEIEYVNMKSKSDHIYLTFNQPSERQKLYRKIMSAFLLAFWPNQLPKFFIDGLFLWA